MGQPDGIGGQQAAGAVFQRPLQRKLAALQGGDLNIFLHLQPLLPGGLRRGQLLLRRLKGKQAAAAQKRRRQRRRLQTEKDLAGNGSHKRLHGIDTDSFIIPENRAEVNLPENGRENLHSCQELCLDKAAEVLYHKTCY